MKKIYEIFDLVRLKSISKRRHGSTAIINLMLNLFSLQTFADGTQIRPKLPPVTIDAMTMLTSFFVEEDGSGFLTFIGIGVNHQCGPPQRVTYERCRKDRETHDDEDSQVDFGMFFQRN